MSAPAHRWITPEEYLALEERAEFRSEYLNGEIIAMAGSSPEHNLISVNISRSLADQLEDHPCRVYAIDLRIMVSETGLYTYPDVVVACGESMFDGLRPHSLLNPTLIVEVLPETTEAYDRGDKFANYQTLPSLREYVLVASNKRRIERFSRSENESDWVLSACNEPDGVVDLLSIGCRLSLSRVYHKVELQPIVPMSRREPGTDGRLQIS